jgi:septal ring factor EnvC (AmiA/AmiB activator)
MTTSSTSEISRPLSRSEYVSTLPLWRRLLAMFNWRPVYDIEQEIERLKISSRESEKRIQESEKRAKQIESETEQIKSETEQLRQENKRLAVLNSRMDALLRNADSSSQTPPATDSN